MVELAVRLVTFINVGRNRLRREVSKGTLIIEADGSDIWVNGSGLSDYRLTDTGAALFFDGSPLRWKRDNKEFSLFFDSAATDKMRKEKPSNGSSSQDV